MMKAVVLHEADEMRVEQRPVPDPGSGEVLLKVNVTSICGTDVKVLHRKLLGQPDGPFIMGHEYAGTVAALGPGVDEFKVGDRVAVEVHKGCERCENCIKGWYTSCLNYGNLAKGHRAKGLTCDLDEEAHYIYTFQWHRIVVHSARVRGWTITPSHFLNNQLDTVWLAEP